MRLSGYCESCRRVRTVTVSRLRPGGVQVGVCSECEEERREPFRDRMVVVGDDRLVHLTTHRGITGCGKPIRSRAPYPIQGRRDLRCEHCFKEVR